MNLTPIQKTAMMWLVPCVLLGVVAAGFCVREALYMQHLIDSVSGYVREDVLFPHRVGAWVALYLAPPMMLGAFFLMPFMVIRIWYGRKSGPGSSHFDATLQHAKEDLMKSIGVKKSKAQAEAEAVELSNATPSAEGKASPIRRL